MSVILSSFPRLHLTLVTLLDLDSLPGCNPIQDGPDPATMVPDCVAPSTTIDVPVPTESQKAIIPPWPVCHPGPETHSLAPMCSPTATAEAVPAATGFPAVVTQI